MSKIINYKRLPGWLTRLHNSFPGATFIVVMLKQKKLNSLLKFIKSTPTLIITIVVASGSIIVPRVSADQFDAQITALQQANAVKQEAKSQLGSEAASLSDAMYKLQVQIDALQSQIDANKAKMDDLQNQIIAAETELAKQKVILGESIKAMYLEGQISTLEMLASSKDLSEFVDKQQYRTAVQAKIKTSVDKITELKIQLKEQKLKVEQTLNDLQILQARVDTQRAEQARLLSLNQSEQNALNIQIRQNSQAVAALRAEQAAANARLFNGANVVLGTACDTAHGDTYPSPWCSSYQDSMFDSWGMYNRECVSYTAWRVAESGRYMPPWGWQGLGNANQWDDDAIAQGIPVDGNPRAGDVAIKNSMPFGHAMYVESVNSNGSINISQYNYSYDGRFSLAYNVSASGLVFIHFP